MTRKSWSQYVCLTCKHINFVPPHDVDPTDIPCAICGEATLIAPEAPYIVVMPKFRAGGNVKPQATGT